jgi:hypothetical protein
MGTLHHLLTTMDDTPINPSPRIPRVSGAGFGDSHFDPAVREACSLGPRRWLVLAVIMVATIAFSVLSTGCGGGDSDEEEQACAAPEGKTRACPVECTINGVKGICR